MKIKEKLYLSNPDKVYKAINNLWADFPEYDKARENMFVLYLDVKNKLLCIELHSQGTIDQCIVYPREIIRKGLFCNCAGIILVHNHPSENTNPSNSDNKLTEQIKTVANYMDIKLLDHVIISNFDDKGFYSFNQEGDL